MAEEALLRAGGWRTAGRGVLFLAAIFTSWLVLGFSYAAGGWWWSLGVPALVVLLAVSIMELVAISEDVPWAVWGTWPFFLVLVLLAGLPGHYYMRAYGEPVSAVVAEREWIEGSKRKYDHYEYVLRGPDGRLVAEEFTDLRGEPEVGARVTVLEDPLGVMKPLQPLEDFDLLEKVALAAWSWITLATVVLSVMGERRRAVMLPKGSRDRARAARSAEPVRRKGTGDQNAARRKQDRRRDRARRGRTPGEVSRRSSGSAGG